LTGGTSNLKGITRVVEEYLHIPSRIGLPENTTVLDNELRQAQYSAVLGALLYDMKSATSDTVMDHELLGNWLGRMIYWFRDLFR